MFPDDPVFERVMWFVIRFVFLPALVLGALALIVGIIASVVMGI